MYEAPRYMTVGQAALQLTSALANRTSNNRPLKCEREIQLLLRTIFRFFLDLSEESLCVGVARVGSGTQGVCHAPLRTMTTINMGEPLQSMVVAGKLHPLEEKMLNIVSLPTKS